MLLKIVYLLMRWLFGLTVLVFRGDRAKDAELPVVRHENAVLRRNALRVRYHPADRAWFAVLTRFIPRRRWAEVFPVTPAPLLAWHRRLAARKYDTSQRRGQPSPAPDGQPDARKAAGQALRGVLAQHRSAGAAGTSGSGARRGPS